MPFADFSKVANLGHHTAAIDGTAHISIHAVQMFFDPYVHGTLFTNLNVASVWGGIGGYFTASVGALALLGLFGQRLRPLRIYLAAWTIIGLCGAWNFLELRKVWNLIPLIENVSFGRYIMSSCELSFILLAAFGLMDLAESAKAKRLFTVTTSVMLLGLVWIVLAASSLNDHIVYHGRARYIYAFLDAIPFIAIIALLVLGRLTKHKIVPLLVAVVLVGESLLMFGVPSGGSAKYVNVDMAPIQYLQKNEGNYRFFDFAVLTPNWGSQYGLNELNAIDLPFPKKFSMLIERQLYPGLTPSNQFVIHDGMTGMIAQENEIVSHFKYYEDASVKYLMMPTALLISPALTALGVTQVFSDRHRHHLRDARSASIHVDTLLVVHRDHDQRQQGHRGLSERRLDAHPNRTDDGRLEGPRERRARHDQDRRPRRLPEREGATGHFDRDLQLLAAAREVRRPARPARRTLPARHVGVRTRVFPARTTPLSVRS